MQKRRWLAGIFAGGACVPASAATLVAGWENFTGSTGWAATQLDPETTVTVNSTTEHNPWGGWNFNNQGASDDGTFGDLDPAVASADPDFQGGGKNLSLNRSNGTIVFTLTNQSGADRIMDGFFFDSISRFSDSARAWTLDFGGALAGATVGANLAHPGSMSGATSAQRDISVDLSGLSDMVWEAGSDAIITLGFTGASNSGSGGGQELVVDNIGITVVPEPSSTLLAGLAGLGLLVTRRRPGSVPVAS